MRKTALITGVTGQDGSYLAELLISKNYRIIGCDLQQAIGKNTHFSDMVKKQIEFVVNDITDVTALHEIILQYKPDEVYNLASQSKPGKSWNCALDTLHINGLGAHQLFDLVRLIKPSCRIYQASSSEMFGNTSQQQLNETTAFNPTNPYAASKLYAHNIANIYRQSYNLFISCGILFNHESPRREMCFITQKITYGAACIKMGIANSPQLSETGEPIVKNNKLLLGNLTARRDWGYAGDYVKAMWLMLQQDHPDDFVIGTGEVRTIKQLCETAFAYLNLNWKQHVIIDERFIRPIETKATVADASKARDILGWQAETPFTTMIKQMVDTHLTNLAMEYA
jgi:GDPmannose 4,6-dehydratase